MFLSLAVKYENKLKSLLCSLDLIRKIYFTKIPSSAQAFDNLPPPGKMSAPQNNNFQLNKNFIFSCSRYFCTIISILISYRSR